jgi:ATP phosphoribosyltransferase regulatory subunit
LILKTVNDHRTDRWLLPDGVNELMPEDAWRVETLRRLIMDSCHSWGYELVMPPLIEYLDSLLTGTGETLGLHTFKFIDQHNGRTLGVRADMTPQVARIDAHALYREQPNRLFYTGSVLRARTDGAGGSRTPIQFGAEIFGHSGPESDIEIVQLMIDNVILSGLGASDLLLDVGHVAVFRGLIKNTELNSDEQERLFQALLRGSGPEVADLLESEQVSARVQEQIRALSLLSGESSAVLGKARDILSGSGPDVLSALDKLESVIHAIQLTYPELRVHVDLAELRGYRYHTGVLFALYDAAGVELARGGRYDDIGEAFGRARPATGFSGDLVKLALTASTKGKDVALQQDGIWIDTAMTADLWQQIRTLRQAGERVVCKLEGSTMDARDCRCDRQLMQQGSNWVVEPLR